MESLFAISIGLVLRVVVDVVTDNDDRISGVLVGLWEGVVLNHFIRRMPHSFDPYLGFGFRIFVDFLFTQSLSRLALVALWALVAMLLADIAPNFWRDSGLRHIYRQVRKDVRHVKRAVPRIRIKNDLPSVRLFNRSRSTSSEVPGSIRSDRATPSRSPAPSRAPTPGPARRSGRSPPGTFPDVSGWSETATNVSGLRERIVTTPVPSPALIPSREDMTYAHIGATHVATSQKQTTVQDTTITVTQTQNRSVLLESAADAIVVGATAASTSLEPVDDSSHHNPPMISDDWVDVNHPTPAQATEPVAPFQSDPDSTPEALPGPSTLTQSQPTYLFDPPPTIDIHPNVSFDADAIDRGSRLPDQIPLPESRAASVIGGVYDQPLPRSALHDSHLSHVDKATSEIGIVPAKSFATSVATQSITSQSASRTWATSWRREKLKRSVDADAPDVPPKDTQRKLADQGKLDMSDAVQDSVSSLPTPAQVDSSANTLTQPGDIPPPLLRSAELVSEQQQEQFQPSQTPPSSAVVDSKPTPIQGGANKGDTAEPNITSSFSTPSPFGTPPPPFTEFVGVSEDPGVERAPAEQDPVTRDEVPTELSAEQKAAEEKRLAFLLIQVRELEGSHADLKRRLNKEDDSQSRPAKAIESDLEDAEKTLNSAKARIAKTKFSDPPSDPSIQEISLTDKTAIEAQFAVATAVLHMLLARDDAGPMTIRAVINRQKPLKGKAKDAKEAITAFTKRHKFLLRNEPATPGIVNITF